MRLKSSSIFNAAVKKTSDSMTRSADRAGSSYDEDQTEDAADMRELVDLTSEQQGKTTGEASGSGSGSMVDDLDEFDLLEATIDPMDLKTLKRVEKLTMEIEREKQFIAMRMAFKAGMSADDPMKISI